MPDVDQCLLYISNVSQEYERLAAQLDGARTPLVTKVQNFASAESKIPLVEEAEKHAELLNTLAMNLTEYVHFLPTAYINQVEEADSQAAL